MTSVVTPEDADLRRNLPPECDAVLEWCSAYRARCTVGEHLGGTPPRVRVAMVEAGPTPPPETVLVLSSGDTESRRWYGRVVEVGDAGIVLEITPDPGNSRSYFRMPVRMTLRLFLPDDPLAGAAAPSTKRQTIARVDELSGGGCRFFTAPDTVSNGGIYFGRLPLEEDRTPMEVRLRVVRVVSRGECDEVAAGFLDLREAERQRILRRLFEEYRRVRREVARPQPDRPDSGPGVGSGGVQSLPHPSVRLPESP